VPVFTVVEVYPRRTGENDHTKFFLKVAGNERAWRVSKRQYSRVISDDHNL
jgi:hypothetical protein